MRRSSHSVLLAGALTLVLAAPASAAGATTVEMRTLSYAPSLVTFPAPGRAVRWKNVTSPNRLHGVISSLPDSFGSSLLSSGGTYRFTFTAAGSFTYICSIHDVMLGRIEVAPVVEVIDEGSGPRLRITLGTVRLDPSSGYRWSVFLRGPSDAGLRWARWAQRPVIEIPVAEPGAWTVMVRVRHRATGTLSSDSPSVTVTVPT